jgi:hypothetical protein
VLWFVAKKDLWLEFKSFCKKDLRFVAKKPYGRLGALCLDNLCEAKLEKDKGWSCWC